MENEIIELNQLTTVEDIYTIENNYAAVEKICDDVYCNIPKYELDEIDVYISEYGPAVCPVVSLSIYKGSRSIKSIIMDNKYHIIISKYGKIIAVFKISNLDNKIIEFNKTNNMGSRFNVSAFYEDNNFIFNIRYKK